MYTYQQTQTPDMPCGELWTTGRYDNGRWLPESDWGTEEEARERAESLNAAIATATIARNIPVTPAPISDDLLLISPAMEFPRTIERIRRESPEEYRERGMRRAAEFRADFAAVAARLPKA